MWTNVANNPPIQIDRFWELLLALTIITTTACASQQVSPCPNDLITLVSEATHHYRSSVDRVELRPGVSVTQAAAAPC